MIKILVNALSVTNQSGLHVLAGHLNRLVDNLQAECRFVVLYRESMVTLNDRFGDRVDWIVVPEKTSHWFFRASWEIKNLQAIANRWSVKVYFTPSGIAASVLKIPQVVLCQNPWALVPAARHRRDVVKAWLQRRAYRKTMRTAAVMVFNSRYMQQAYRKNAGFKEKRGLVVYQAADDPTRIRSEQWKDRPRVSGQIVCVSAMAPHKNIESLIHAFEMLSSTTKLPTSNLQPPTSSLSLRLIGSWPDSAYKSKIQKMVMDKGLESQIYFDGFVSREELDQAYAESQVFCLMSRCESFGIPAIEAQLFGTPVVCSTACAVPEICGEGGLFCDPDDVEGIAEALQCLLNDSDVWNKYSEQARVNAERFCWETCSPPLVEVFNAETQRRRVE